MNNIIYNLYVSNEKIDVKSSETCHLCYFVEKDVEKD